MKKMIAIILAAAMGFSLTACGSGGGTDSAASGSASGSASSEDSSKPETLEVGTLDSTDTFDPCSNSDCKLGLMLVYDTILKLDYETMEPQADIATEWNWLDDKTLELTIRDDVKFSNGDELTPEDVLYSMRRFVDENDQFDPGFDNIDFDNSTIDGNKLTLKLYEVDADFLIELCNESWACVVDEEYVKENPDSWWNAPVGSGPYTCEENVEGSHAGYKIRDDYWGDKPDAEEIIVHNYTESTTMIADFENGDLDIVLDVPETDYLAADAGDYGDDVQTKLFNSWNEIGICLPQYNKTFQDVKVRQAISYAIDTEAMANAIFGSLGEHADSFLIKGCDYYVSIGTHEYDPEKAKELLNEAGYGDGMELKLVIPSMPANEKCAEILQAYLAEVGITVNVESYDFATAIPILMKNGTDIGIFGTGGGTFTASSIFSTISTSNTNTTCKIDDEEFNAYIDAGLSTVDTEKRQESYTAAAQWVYDNYWTLPIAYSQAANLYHGDISGMTGLNARTIDLKQIVID